MFFLLVLFYWPTHICFSSPSSITSLRLCPSARRAFPSTTANSPSVFLIPSFLSPLAVFLRLYPSARRAFPSTTANNPSVSLIPFFFLRLLVFCAYVHPLSCLSIDHGKQPFGFPNPVFSFSTYCFSAPIPIRPSRLSLDNGKQPFGFPNPVFSFSTYCFSAPMFIRCRAFPSTTANSPSVSLIPFFFLRLLVFCAYVHPLSCLSIDHGKQPFGFPNPVFSFSTYCFSAPIPIRPSRLSIDNGKQPFGFPDPVFSFSACWFSAPMSIRLSHLFLNGDRWPRSLFPCIAYCFSIAMPHPVFTFPLGAVDSYRFSIRQAPV